MTASNNKTPRLLSIDLGYSAVKVCRYNEEGVLVFDKFISAVARLPNDGLEPEDNEQIFRLGIDYYALGTAALKQPRSFLLNLNDFESLKQAYPVWISYLLNKYGGVDAFDHVIIGLSIAFRDKADSLLAYLYETLMIDHNKAYFLCLSQGLVMKEAYFTYGLNLREPSTRTEQKLQNALFIDGGFETLDIVAVTGGKSVLSGAVGIPNSGVVCIAQQVQDFVYKQYNMRISIKEAATIVDNRGTFNKRGKNYNIMDQVDKFSKIYLKNVFDLIEDKFAEYLDAVQGVLVLGGLSYILARYIEEDDMKAEIEKHFPISFIHYADVDAEYYNCLSYMRIIEKKLGYKID
jgi:hypothetical protein